MLYEDPGKHCCSVVCASRTSSVSKQSQCEDDSRCQISSVTVICLPSSQRVFMNSLLYVFISFRLLLVSDRYSNIKFSQFPVVNRELSQSSRDFYFFFWISLHLSCCCTSCNLFTIVFKPPIPCLGCLIPLFTYYFLYSDLTLFYRRVV